MDIAKERIGKLEGMVEKYDHNLEQKFKKADYMREECKDMEESKDWF